MKKIQIISSILIICVFIFSSCDKSKTSDKVKLELKAEKGKVFNQILTIQQRIKTEVQGQEQTMDQTMKFGFSYKVEDIAADSTISMSCTYISVGFKMAMGTQSVEYDSQNPSQSDNPMSKILSSFVGKSFGVKFSPSMQIKEVTGMSELLDTFITSLDVPESERSIVKEQFSKQFGNEAIKESYQSSFTVLPNNPIGVGDTWTSTMNFSETMPMSITNTYTVKDRKDGKMTVAVNAKIEPNKNGSTIDMGFGPIEYKLSGTMDGNVILDEATGWLVSSNLNQKISGTMMIDFQGKKIETPIDIEGNITFEQKK